MKLCDFVVVFVGASCSKQTSGRAGVYAVSFMNEILFSNETPTELIVCCCCVSMYGVVLCICMQLYMHSSGVATQNIVMQQLLLLPMMNELGSTILVVGGNSNSKSKVWRLHVNSNDIVPVG